MKAKKITIIPLLLLTLISVPIAFASMTVHDGVKYRAINTLGFVKFNNTFSSGPMTFQPTSYRSKTYSTLGEHGPY